MAGWQCFLHGFLRYADFLLPLAGSGLFFGLDHDEVGAGLAGVCLCGILSLIEYDQSESDYDVRHTQTSIMPRSGIQCVRYESADQPGEALFHLIEEGSTWTVKVLIRETVFRRAVEAAYYAPTVAMAMSLLE
jgi:hypothetical protein